MKISYAYLLMTIVLVTGFNVQGQEFDLSVKIRNSTSKTPLANANILLCPALVAVQQMLMVIIL